MKQIIKYISVIMLLLCSTEAFALRGGYGVDKGTVAGGDIAFYSDENCKNAISERPKANAAVYIKATANYNKRLGDADAQGKVSFIKVEQTVSSGVAMTRGDGLGLGEYVDVYQVSRKLDEGIYKFTMPADENINVLVSAEFAEPAPNQNIKISSIANKYNVDENAPVGTVVALITVVDKNKVDGDYETLNYKLTSIKNADLLNEAFQVNEVNNFAGVRTIEISVKNQELLDFEKVNDFIVALYIEDESDDYVGAQFDININDLNEDFTLSDQTFTLAEKQEDGSNWPAGKEIANIKLTSQENISEDHFIWKVITTGIPFDLAPGTNKLVLTDGSVLDYETKPTWTFKISASDGVYTHNATITVNLTDLNEAPAISDCKNNYTVKENSAAGTELGVLTVFDCDKDDVLSYSLENTDLNGIFELQEKKVNAGTRTVSIVVKDASKLDYEKLYKSSEENATYPITITATDTDGNSASVKTYIAIEDVNEDLTATGGTFYLNEHSPVGSKVYKEKDCQTVGKVSAEDKDLYHADFRKLSYKMSTNNTGTDAEKFKVDPRSGVITSAAVFDYETDSKENHIYTFLVTVSDGEFSKDVEVKVEIQNIEEPTINLSAENKAPKITAKEFQVPEDATSSYNIGNIEATDPNKNDIENNEPLFYELCYMLNEDEEVKGNTDFPFEIDENTGAITIRQGETLNYAKQNKYVFKVKVTDCASYANTAQLSTTETITINVTDVNRPSKFISLGNVYDVDENEEKGTEVNGDKILVYDEDAADKDKLEISITDNNATAALDAAKLFEVVQDGKTNNKSESSFVIKTKAGLDYEALYKSIDKDAIFNVKLTITDTKGNTTFKDCKIRVNDVNEKPEPSDENIEGCIIENIFEFIRFGKVEVSDPDRYNTEYSTLYYSLEGDDAALFAINAAGEISKINGAILDYETKDEYKFNVVVSDKKNTVKIPVTIKVNNEKELPEFTEKNPVLLVDERAEKGTVVGTVSATDDDMKNNKSGKAPKYSFRYGQEYRDGYLFNINESTGEITVKEDYLSDFNTKHEYHVKVVAADGDDPWLFSYVDVVIKAQLKMENLFSSDNAFTSYVAPDNMAVPEGLSAYVVTNIDGASATISQIDYLPQSMPVLLKRADKDVNLFKTITGNGTAFYVNKLMINETDREVSVGELYLLYRDEFVLNSSGTLPAGCVYLPISAGVAKTRSLGIGYDNGTTAIDDVERNMDDDASDKLYDLQGRQLGSKPNRKGIYISNGRKVVIK